MFVFSPEVGCFDPFVLAYTALACAALARTCALAWTCSLTCLSALACTFALACSCALACVDPVSCFLHSAIYDPSQGVASDFREVILLTTLRCPTVELIRL